MTAASPIVSIMIDRKCIGFLMHRGVAGVEAFNEHASLGLFPDRDKAIAAVAERISKQAPAP
jgi:hypothetical protein